MAIKIKIKKGDTVRVIAGSQKGAEGTVLSITKENNKAIVEGINLVNQTHKIHKGELLKKKHLLTFRIYQYLPLMEKQLVWVTEWKTEAKYVSLKKPTKSSNYELHTKT
jgi:ribosomal protein L24